MPHPRRGITNRRAPPPQPAAVGRNRVVADFREILARQGPAGFRAIGGLEITDGDDDNDDDEDEEDDSEDLQSLGDSENDSENEDEEEESDDGLVPVDNDETDEEEHSGENDDGEEDDEEEVEVEGEEDEGEEMDDANANGGQQGRASLLGLKEISHLASWTVSSSKPGCGVAELRSEDTNLFWQSDGSQPHLINIHFAKRVFVQRMRIFLDYSQDESYTPTKIAVLAGTGYHDLQDVCTLEFNQPIGWQEIPLDGVHSDGILRAFLIQVCVLSNHQSGKDTHVRGLQIYSPLECFETKPAYQLPIGDPECGDVFDLSPIWFSDPEAKDVPFQTVQMLSELELR
ncbi:anaphase promoting complex subunit doc1 [Orbilia brochopaga]|uniref:Anaphase promoting complex subunit doc1 n=1 Tax=Orbilia brochopaga TaxID=3140254 RepID=A0AAV9UZX4_9PEZI